MIHNGLKNITTDVTILFVPKKGPLWSKKGIFKPKKAHNRAFWPKTLSEKHIRV